MNRKRWMTLRSGLIGLALTGLIVSACAPASQVTRSTVVDRLAQVLKSSAQALAGGAAAQSGSGKQVPDLLAKLATLGQEQTWNDVVITPIAFEPLTGPADVQPKAGDQYFSVKLSIENAGRAAAFKFDPADLTLADTSGKSFSGVNLKSLADQLQAQTLKPGEKVEGVVVFEVPQHGATWYLKFGDAGKQSLTWSLIG